MKFIKLSFYKSMDYFMKFIKTLFILFNEIIETSNYIDYL